MIRGESAAARGRLEIRSDVRATDVATVRAIAESTGNFYPGEVAVAVELVAERLAKGEASGYHFVFAMRGDESIGYACFGPIACTRSSWDLYWIAVNRSEQRTGLGRALVGEVERAVHARGGTQIYIDTSNRAQYAATRAFYEACGYRLDALLRDFYAPGDDKAIYCRRL